MPGGRLAYAVTAPAMAHAIGLDLPYRAVHPYHAGGMVALVTAGMAIAALGALLPAVRAGRLRTADALRQE